MQSVNMRFIWNADLITPIADLSKDLATVKLSKRSPIRVPSARLLLDYVVRFPKLNKYSTFLHSNALVRTILLQVG